MLIIICFLVGLVLGAEGVHTSGRHSGLTGSALDSRLGGLGSSPGKGHCVVFLGKILYFHSASDLST